jgi:hypothetical protein
MVRRISNIQTRRGVPEGGNSGNYTNFRFAFGGSDQNVEPPTTEYTSSGPNAAKRGIRIKRFY